MAQLTTPVMTWPFRLGPGATAFEFVEQGTPLEITQCVALIFSTNVGELIDDPELGLKGPEFRQGGVTVPELVGATREFEPRARIAIDSNQIVGLAQTVGIEVGES